ncbi:hypothetical protein BJ741DRAFT_31331 [Chytriomyces cf. hyalinus JEL632]|nr:hypothetical protein BJ741DRAFT_31331 [Chytriomyces cf. hyalinus JEL632]
MRSWVIFSVASLLANHANAQGYSAPSAAPSPATTTTPAATPAASTTPAVATTPAVMTTPAPQPTSLTPDYTLNCAGLPDNSMVCRDSKSFALCSGGQPAAGTLYCPGTTVCCGRGLQQCQDSCDGSGPATPSYTPAATPTATPVIVPVSYGYNPPPAVGYYGGPSCAGKADGQPVCIDSNTIQLCLNGLLVPNTPTQSCPAGTVCCENLPSGCGYPGCSVPATVSGYGGPSCAGKKDGQHVCLDSKAIQLCENNALVPNTPSQNCAPGTVCCENIADGCGWPGCGVPVSYTGYNQSWGYDTQPPTGYNPKPDVPGTSGGYDGGYNPKPDITKVGPAHDWCDERINDYSMSGKFCVGTRSNMWCDNGEISRINFCPTGQICCENTGECGVNSHEEGLECYAPKDIPTRVEGCRCDKPNDATFLSDGARVCTGPNTFSYALDKVPASLYHGDLECPAGFQCCPNLGGRCEEDCDYPATPVGSCHDQPDGASVCNGYSSYKLCHNGGCLGTFDCEGEDMVCCPTTGSCAPKSSCDSHTFMAEVDDKCHGYLNKRVCTKEGNVNICLAGIHVATFPSNGGYDFGCKWGEDSGKPYWLPTPYGQPGYSDALYGKKGYGYGDAPAPATGYGDAPAPAKGYGDAPAPAKGYGDAPAPAKGYGDAPAPAKGYGDAPAPAKGYGDAPAPAKGYGDAPAPAKGYSDPAPPKGYSAPAPAKPVGYSNSGYKPGGESLYN